MLILECLFLPLSLAQNANNGGLEMEIDCNNLQQQLPINARPLKNRAINKKLWPIIEEIEMD